MSLIEGIGDEVTNFFVAVCVVVVCWIAWRSTNINSEQPLIRTVLILPHRTRARIAELRGAQNAQLNVNLLNRPPDIEPTVQESVRTTESTPAEESQLSSSAAPTVPAADGISTESSVNRTETTSEETLIQAMDSFNNGEDQLDKSDVSENASAVAKKVDADKPATQDQGDVKETTEKKEEKSDKEPTSIPGEISIKLKYINDDQKLVSGGLKELLGDFKRRHFQPELEARKLVRLVFNGHVLQPDSQTLEKCGLFHNCVVHCLVHQPRQPPSAAPPDNSSAEFNSQHIPQAHATNNGARRHNAAAQYDWDLSRLLVSILTLVLGLAWYSRYHYAQLFTATTTIALYALTAIFTVSVYGHFYSDQESARVIE